MDKSVAKKDINKNYDEVEALGAYIFTIFNEENDEEKDCQGSAEDPRGIPAPRRPLHLGQRHQKPHLLR